MYGLLVENLASFIRIQWGEGKWDMVRKNAGIDAPSFSIHHVYPETLLNKLAKSAFQVLGVDDKSFFEAMGIYFIEYVGQYGYDAMLTVLGRHMRDFLNGLDNLHEYLKFSYTKMRAPSFYCDNETANGLRLHYRSRRRGFVYYVIGQIKQVARHFYNQDCEIEILTESLDGETMHTIFQLTFDNDAFCEAESLKSMIRQEQQLPIRASIIFELFPFCLVFNQEMQIKFTGHALLTILKDLVGQCMTEAFEIVKPLISFCFTTILERRNNIFELITIAPIKDDEALTGSLDNDDDEGGTSLRLRGQMLHMEEWDMILFLANPVMPDLTSLIEAGLYINDLSLHDCSRDLVLAGTQQSVELKLALDQEQHKSKKLEDSMKKLDEEMKRTDELLYQMIPKKVADRIRTGENPTDTCEVFECVSILFSDVVTFTDICSRITPMQVVGMLNHMYSLFDQLTERNGVYKVETIGDSYMVVSGAPEPIDNHAERICDMAMDMVDAMVAIQDPSREGESLKIRVGCHSGMVVAGVVGVKMPRYCLFGDAVNTASRMESTSVGGKIQISESCRSKLPAPYQTEKRGTVAVKGKGEMDTHWLHGREARVPLSKINSKSFNWEAPKSSNKEVKMTKQLSKQISLAAPVADDTSLVKDKQTERNKFVRQSTVYKSSLESITQQNEPKSSFNEPVDKSGAAEANASSPPKSAPSPAPAPALKPVPQKPVPLAKELLSKSSANNDVEPSSQIKSISRSSSLTPAAAEEISKVQTPSAPSPQSSSLNIPNAPAVNIRRASVVSIAEPVPQPAPQVQAPTPTPSPPAPSDNNPPPVSVKRPSIDTNSPEANIIAPAVNIKRPSIVINAADLETEVAESKKMIPNGNEEMIQRTMNNLSPNDIANMENKPEEVKTGGNERRKSNFMEGFNGIRKGSREFRNKIKDKKLTVESITEAGCMDFVAKQKDVISQACSLL